MNTPVFAVACLGGIGLVGVVVCCGLGWLILSGVKDEAALHDQLAYHGIQAKSEIVNKRSSGGGGPTGRGSAHYYYVTYRYDVKAADGTISQLTREAEVSADTYDKLDVGTQIDIQYLPDDPKVSRFRGSVQEKASPEGMRAEAYRDIAIGIGIGVFFAFVVILILTHSK